jgi:hypothetical protein
MDSPSASSATLSIHSDHSIHSDYSEHSVDALYEESDYPDPPIPNEYLEPVHEDSLSPSMKAASDPDCRILEALIHQGYARLKERLQSYPSAHLKYYSSSCSSSGCPLFCRLVNSSEFDGNAVRSNGRNRLGITTPLMEALRARMPFNVKILLNAGANPDGAPLHVFEKHAALFLRFRPSIQPLMNGSKDLATRAEYLGLMDLPQISTLTEEEVGDRRWDGLAPFWCEEGFTPSSFWIHGKLMHSLVEAAGLGHIEDFDLLLESGADASFWMRPRLFVPEPPSTSSLCISTPIHAAIENGKHSMLRHILDMGFDPNTMALSNPTRCVTPLMATIIRRDRFDKESFNILSTRPNINFDIRTPVYDVHLLHFAVAKLDLSMLKHVVSFVPLRNAGTTALGHTLLHIACMPSKNNEIQHRSDMIMKSIHETRDTRQENDHNFIPAHDPWFSRHPSELYAQSIVVQYLWDNGICDIESKDVHGNTALHYLAACRGVNYVLLSWMMRFKEVAQVWTHSQNGYTATPDDLRAAGMSIALDSAGGYPLVTPKSLWKISRAIRKEKIWDRLLVHYVEKSG